MVLEQEAGAKSAGATAATGGERSAAPYALIKQVYETDPLSCPKCGSEMKLIAFIQPDQGAVIEKILRHCG